MCCAAQAGSHALGVGGWQFPVDSAELKEVTRRTTANMYGNSFAP